MMPKKYILPALILALALFSLSVQAEVVVLKTGKKIEVEKVWQENGQTWIVFHGMNARIPEAKVDRIESNSKSNPGSLDLKKEESAKLKKISGPAPQETPSLQTNH